MLAADRLPAELLALLAACKAQPEEDAPRLVLADCLEEHGQPERAEHIRLQLQLARLPDWELTPAEVEHRIEELVHRERELEERHSGAWIGALADLLKCRYFQRGLLAGRLREFPPEGDPLAGLAAVAAWPWLEYLQVADRLVAQDVARLANSPHLADLSALELLDNGLDDEGAATLAASPYLANLTSLSLWNNRIGDTGARALAASPYLARLTSLSLTYIPIGAEGAAALAASPHLANLALLKLESSRIGAEGARALAASPHLARLVELDLRHNDIGDKGARALAASPHLANLRSLDLGYNGIGRPGIKALVASPHLANLHSLTLAGNGILGRDPDPAEGEAEGPMEVRLWREAEAALRQRFGERVRFNY